MRRIGLQLLDARPADYQASGTCTYYTTVYGTTALNTLAQIPLGSSRLDTTRLDTLDTTNSTRPTRARQSLEGPWRTRSASV